MRICDWLKRDGRILQAWFWLMNGGNLNYYAVPHTKQRRGEQQDITSGIFLSGLYISFSTGVRGVF